jgi:hypothetical protein
MTHEIAPRPAGPVHLPTALASFADVYDPRIVDVFVVPKGTVHRRSSPGGSILMFEPSGTSSTGDRHEGDIPDHVQSTAGRDLYVSASRRAAGRAGRARRYRSRRVA